jgi:REP element-mobilizing transposase RayT
MNTENKSERSRRSIRVQGYDYSEAGPYFITVCSFQSKPVFGKVVEEAVQFTAWGHIVQECWSEIPSHFPRVELDQFIVMPNHIHGIVAIVGCRGTACRAPTTRAEFGKPAPGSLPTIIGSFKSAVTKRINEVRGSGGESIWQRNYYEHIIRDEESLNRIREYIFYNPLKWSLDRENPERTGEDDFDRWLACFNTRPGRGTACRAPTSGKGAIT